MGAESFYTQEQTDGFSDQKSPKSTGEWQTEDDSVSYLKPILTTSGLFRIYNQVEGRIIQPRPFCSDKKMRIDFILSPTARLRSAGWSGGPMGLECKKSGLKINEPLAQVLDYARTIWLLPSGYMFMCQYFFIWPYHKLHGFYASIMAQNRIGTLSYDDRHFAKSLSFYCGEQKAIKYSFLSDKIEIGDLSFGFKAGSR